MLIGKQIIIVSLITAGAAMLLMAVVAWRRRPTAGPAALYLALCTAAMAVYNFGYALELSSTTLPEIIFWVRIQHWGIQAIAPTWLLFALCMAGQEKRITPLRVIALSLPAIFFFLAAQTLGGANLTHLNPRLNTAGPFPTFDYDRTVIAWLNVIYSTSCLALGMLIFIMLLQRAAPTFRKQAAIFLGGSSISWLALLLYTFGLTPYSLDLSPLALSLSALALALGFLKYQVLDIVPLARDVIFEGMYEGALVLDTQNRILDYNARLQAMLPGIRMTNAGYTTFEALAAYPALVELIRGDTASTVELSVRDHTGTHYYRCQISPLLNRRKKLAGRIITLYDVTETRRLLEQLAELASLDDLTGAFNRRRFTELSAREIERLQHDGGMLALVMFDLDYYKNVNDTYGHAAGDMALKVVVEVYRTLERRSDIVGRLGGDEFLILLPGTSAEAAVSFAERLRTSLEKHPIQYQGQIFTLTGSFGVTGAAYPGPISLETLYQWADQAVYKAKSAGRNRVCVYIPEADLPLLHGGEMEDAG